MDADLLLDREEEFRVAMETVLRGLHVAMPVKVMKDSDGKTVSLQPTVKARQIQPDGTIKEIEYPTLDAIARFSSGGGTTHTHPVKKDDEGLVILSSLSMHNWREMGGVQSQVDSRRHDLSDATYISGIRSKPRDLKDINTEAAELRSDDGKHKVSLHPQNGPTLSADDGKHLVSVHPKNGITMKTAEKLAVEATKGMGLKGDFNVEGNVAASGTIGAPTLNGQTGGIFTGMMGGLFGALLALMAVHLFPAAGGPSAAPQAVSYVRAALAH